MYTEQEIKQIQDVIVMLNSKSSYAAKAQAKKLEEFLKSANRENRFKLSDAKDSKLATLAKPEPKKVTLLETLQDNEETEEEPANILATSEGKKTRLKRKKD